LSEASNVYSKDNEVGGGVGVGVGHSFDIIKAFFEAA
jgi:hypothetical protein